jgi:predicted O-methyltransferase YrrM
MAVVMKILARALAQLSLAGLSRYAAEPWRIPVFFTRPREQRSFTAFILELFEGLEDGDVEARSSELAGNERFHSALDHKHTEVRGDRVPSGPWWELLYLVVRFAKPRLSVETGVFDGVSSAVILQALADNGGGELISIDLPAVETIAGSTHQMGNTTTLPPGQQPGWIIPDFLREQHRLLLGDSKELLPRVFEEHPEIDLFLHDSLHTYQHQLFEYQSAWPRLKEGGLLLSDDIYSSAAFHRFSRAVGRPYLWLERFGAVKK